MPNLMCEDCGGRGFVVVASEAEIPCQECNYYGDFSGPRELTGKKE